MKEKKKIYAVIDTNVLVSSLFSADGRSNPSRVIKAVLTGIITPLYNGEIIDEYHDVLSRAKFNFAPVLVEKLISIFTDFGIDTMRQRTDEEYFPDADDIVFYEVAMSVEDAYLVTGNIKHFPRRHFIVTPAQMMDIIGEMGSSTLAPVG